MHKIQAAICGLKTLTEILLGQTPSIPDYSTLNQALGIYDTLKPTAADKVKLSTLVMGIGGSSYTTGDNGIPLTTLGDHTADNTGLFQILPLVLRRTDNDLTADQRAKYCLRKEITINNVNYYGYHGFRLTTDNNNVTVGMKETVTSADSGGTITSTTSDFTPTDTDLNPTPVYLPDTGAVTATNTVLTVTALLTVELDQDFITELKAASAILHNGDERYAMVTEWGVCTATDRTVAINTTGGTVNFNEVIACQVYCFAMDHKELYLNSTSLKQYFDVGNTLPLIGAASIPTLETISA